MIHTRDIKSAFVAVYLYSTLLTYSDDAVIRSF